MSRMQSELVRLVKSLENQVEPDFKKCIRVILKSKLTIRRKLIILRKIFGVRKR
jgi:hypothetical protein